ncbi:MAG: TonB-dependent receptor [Novosphingobium sp.]
MRRFALLPLLAMASPALAQTEPAQPVAEPGSAAPTDTTAGGDETDPADEIVVIATRLTGQVDAPQPPLVTLNEEDIASYGAGSITELIAALGTQTSSSRGRGDGFPIMLINGQRISSFREMRNLPPEAIRRMEVLPEEVALKFGYPPNQRVVNMILKDNFASKTVELEYSRPTDGGFDTFSGEASLFKTTGKSRLNLTVSADDTSPLTESERGVIQQTPAPVAGDLDPAPFRTLVADSKNFGFNGTWTTPLGTGANAAGLTLNAAASRADTTSFSGLPTVVLEQGGNRITRYIPDPLLRRSRTDTYQAGLNLNKGLGQWRLTATVDASTATTTTVIDKRPTTQQVDNLQAMVDLGTLSPTGAFSLGDLGQDSARVRSNSVTSLVTLMGRPFSMPAGDVSMTVKGGFAYTGLSSIDTRTDGGEVNLDRGDLSGGINLGIPLTSRRNNVLGGIGDISLNFSGGIDRLSDFGTLYDYSAGLTWGVTEKLSLQASYIVNEAAPSLANLGNPQIATDNVAVYDFSRNQTALVTVITGGNPDLKQEIQRDLKLSANWQLPFFKNSSFLVEYIRNNSDDVTAGFPVLTPAIEAAFPARVRRCTGIATDPANCVIGTLISIDQRPVTFANEQSSRIRYGFNINGTIGKAPPSRQGGFGGMGGGGPRGPGGGGFGGPRGGGGSGFGGPGGPGAQGQQQGRWNIALYHTYRFEETVLVAPGGPSLDLLGGDALTGGGVSRHSLEIEGGAFYKGLGFRLNGTWSAPTEVRGSTLLGTSDLRFGSVFKLNLRVFANLDQQKWLTNASSFFKGARLSLSVDNLLNSRQRVTDAAGQVPLSYQPDLVDPRGRVIGLQLRKQF